MMRSVNIELTKDELLVLNNSLNEVCNGMDLGSEFETRIGCTLQEGRELLSKMRSRLQSMP